MKALEAKAASAEVANRKAEEDLKRMKTLILKGGGGILSGGSNIVAQQASANNYCSSSAETTLFVYNDNDETIKTGGDNKFALGSSKSGKSSSTNGANKSKRR